MTRTKPMVHAEIEGSRRKLSPASDHPLDRAGRAIVATARCGAEVDWTSATRRLDKVTCEACLRSVH